MILIFLIVGFLFSTTSQAEIVLSPQDAGLYQNRHFVELAHSLTDQGKTREAEEILKQERRLESCSSVHRGTADFKAVLQCMGFIDAEDEIKVFSKGRGTVISDLNLICRKLAGQPRFMRDFMDSTTVWSGGQRWRPCSEALWKQVYLTAYANIDAHPIKAVSFLRRARSTLGFNPLWTPKAMKLIQ